MFILNTSKLKLKLQFLSNYGLRVECFRYIIYITNVMLEFVFFFYIYIIRQLSLKTYLSKLYKYTFLPSKPFIILILILSLYLEHTVK